MKRKLSFVTLCATVAILLGSTAFAAERAPVGAAGEVGVTADVCSAPAVFGSYALRACIMHQGASSHAYAFVSLDAGHSPCVIRGRYATTDGWVSKLYTRSCPSGAVTHFRWDLPENYGGGWWFYSAFSIQRTTDGNIAPMAQSPAIWA
jgi:hypothetical protein